MNIRKLKDAVSRSIVGHSSNQAYINEISALCDAYMNCLTYVRDGSEYLCKPFRKSIDTVTFEKFMSDMSGPMNLGAFHTHAFIIIVCAIAYLSDSGKNSTAIDIAKRLAMSNGYVYENICNSMYLRDRTEDTEARQKLRGSSHQSQDIAPSHKSDFGFPNFNRVIHESYSSGCGGSRPSRYTSGC